MSRKPQIGKKHAGDQAKPKNTMATVGRLLRYLKPDGVKITVAFICVLIAAGANLAGSYMLRPLINNFIAPENGVGSVPGLARGLLIMALVFLLGVAATYIQNKTMIKVSQNALQKIRNQLFSKMQKLPVRFFDTNNTGELMSRYTNDVDTIGEMLNSTLIQIFSGVISLIGTLGLMLYTNIYLTLVTVVMVPLFMKVAASIAEKSRVFFRGQQQAIGEVNSYIEETVTGQKVVKVFCHEEICEEEFQERNEALKSRQIKAQFFGGMMGPVMGNLSQISYALTACIGGILCVTKNFDVGGLTIFVNFSRQFSRPINELSMQVTTIMSALAGAERVFDIMDQEPEPEDLPGAKPLAQITGEVALNHVTFGYSPKKTILKEISLAAKPGQKIALVGSTGAGKTTITNLITRFYDIQKGSITIDGTDIRGLQKDSLRSNIAVVLQDTHLFTGTVMENIRYGRLDATDEEVIAAAKTASADTFINHLPEGYQTVLEGDGTNLSQGQRQLLNIARAALSKAPILVLDEATSSVDTRTEQHINKGMESLMENRTTFVIAHRLSTIRNADAIMVLEQGEIIERGTHNQLLARGGRYYELYTGLKELD